MAVKWELQAITLQLRQIKESDGDMADLRSEVTEQQQHNKHLTTAVTCCYDFKPHFHIYFQETPESELHCCVFPVCVYCAFRVNISHHSVVFIEQYHI